MYSECKHKIIATNCTFPIRCTSVTFNSRMLCLRSDSFLPTIRHHLKNRNPNPPPNLINQNIYLFLTSTQTPKRPRQITSHQLALLCYTSCAVYLRVCVLLHLSELAQSCVQCVRALIVGEGEVRLGLKVVYRPTLRTA